MFMRYIFVTHAQHETLSFGYGYLEWKLGKRETFSRIIQCNER